MTRDVMFQKQYIMMLALIGGVAVLATASCSRRPTDVTEAPDFLGKFYQHPPVQETLREFGLSDLRTVRFRKDQTEVRIWKMMMLGHPRPWLTVLKRTGHSSSGRHIVCRWNAPIPEPKILIKTADLKPSTSWEAFWKTMDEHGLLTVQGDPEKVDIHDGTQYLVEVNVSGQYRAYFTNNPHTQESPHAQKLAAMFDAMRTSLGIDAFEKQVYTNYRKAAEDWIEHNKSLQATAQ